MGKETIAPELTDEQIVGLLHQAEEDEQEGRLVRCGNEPELREFFETLRPQ